jgi:hypothetical protein
MRPRPGLRPTGTCDAGTAEGNGTVHERSPKDARKKPNGPAKQIDAKAGDAVTLSTSFIDNDAFISDMARFADQSLTEEQVRKKYRLAESDWIALAENDDLVRKIEDETTRRIRDGSTARERAQIHFATAPNVLGGILNDSNANARHRIESAKELRAIAVPPGQATGADASRFEIILNADVETYNKSRSVMINDPEDISTKSTTIGIDDDAGTAPQDQPPNAILDLPRRRTICSPPNQWEQDHGADVALGGLSTAPEARPQLRSGERQHRRRWHRSQLPKTARRGRSAARGRGASTCSSTSPPA